MAQQFDLVIVGSGSTAFAAALRAAESGKAAALTEVRTLGRTCVNRGCLPCKNLIEAPRILHDSRNPRYPGLSPASMELDFAALIAQKDEVIANYRDKKYQSIVTDSNRIQVFAGGRLDGQSGNAERRRGRRGHERQANETHCCTARSVNVVLLPSPTQFPAVRTENGFGVSISGAWVCLRMMVTKTVTVPRNSTGRPPMSGP